MCVLDADGAAAMESLRAELARAKKQASESDAATRKALEELRAERLDEFRAWCPASSSDVLWKIQLLIGCGIPISTTCQKFSSIRPSELREPSD